MDVWGLTLIGTAGAAAAAWVAYFRWKDKWHPEPTALLVAACIAGAICVLAAAQGFNALGARAPTWTALMGPWDEAIIAALTIGLVEETAKLLPVLAVALLSTHFDELWDGPVYAGVAGVGFAVAETIYLAGAGELGTVDGLGRAVAAPLTHAVFAAPAGLGIAYGVLLRRWAAVPIGFATSVVGHGAYDLALARSGGQLVAAGIVLALWIALIVLGGKLAAKEKVRAGPAS